MGRKGAGRWLWLLVLMTLTAWVPWLCAAEREEAPSLSATLVPGVQGAHDTRLAVNWPGPAGRRLQVGLRATATADARPLAEQALETAMNLLSLPLTAAERGVLELVVRDATGAIVARWSENLATLRGPSGFAWESAFFGAGVDGPINAMVIWDDGHGPALYVGGDFITAGSSRVNGVARWDGQAWSALEGPTGTGVGSSGVPSVYALAVYNGALIIGGAFTVAGGVEANNIARWDGHTWSAFSGAGESGTDGLVYSLSVYDGALIVAGAFSRIAGTPASRIARWNGSAWSTLGSGLEGYGYAMVVRDGALIVGGSFGNAGGVSANNVARWDGSAWSALSGASGNGTNGMVRALAVHGGALIVGGSFTAAGGVSASRVARFDGTSWSALGAGMGGAQNPLVSALTVYNGELIAGGAFPIADGRQANFIARWNGSAWSALESPLGPGLSGAVFSLVVYDGALLAGGTFSQAGGEPPPIGGGVNVNGIARWNGSVWSTLEPSGTGMSSQVSALAVYDGALIVGGSFTRAGTVDAWGIARWDGHAWAPLSGPQGTGVQTLPFDFVGALAVYHGELIVGGQFKYAGGVLVNNIARWNGHEWRPLAGASGVGTSVGAVFALTLHGDSLVAVGAFEEAGGKTVNNVARWDGSEWFALAGPAGIGTDQTVTAATVYQGDLIISAGPTAGGVDVNYIARWNGSAWSGLGSGLSSSVRALTVYDGALIAAGFFTEAGATTVNHVARWDGTAWSGLGGGTTGYGGGIAYALGQYDGALIVGGIFSQAGGLTVNGIARWDHNGWSSLSGPRGSGLEEGGTVFALLAYDPDGAGPIPEKLVVGGSFLTTGGVSNWRLGLYGPAEQGSDLTVNPGTLDFGIAYPPGQVLGPLPATLSNTGGTPLRVASMSDATTPFHRAGGDCPQGAFELAPAQSCVVSYVFVPLTTGDYQQTIRIAPEVGATLDLKLVARALPPPAALVVSPDQLDFGMVPAGITAGPAPFTLTNTSFVPVHIAALSEAAAPFVKAGGDCPAAPFDLAPNSSCTLLYSFSPTQVGPARQTFTIDSDAAAIGFTIDGAGIPGVPSVLALIGGSGQSTSVDRAFAAPLVVQVRDAWNNPVPGVGVTFVAPDSGPSALLSPTSPVTDANGYARVDAVANAQVGRYAVSAHGGLGDPVEFTLTNLPSDGIFGDGFDGDRCAERDRPGAGHP